MRRIFNTFLIIIFLLVVIEVTYVNSNVINENFLSFGFLTNMQTLPRLYLIAQGYAIGSFVIFFLYKKGLIQKALIYISSITIIISLHLQMVSIDLPINTFNTSLITYIQESGYLLYPGVAALLSLIIANRAMKRKSGLIKIIIYSVLLYGIMFGLIYFEAKALGL